MNSLRGGGIGRLPPSALGRLSGKLPRGCRVQAVAIVGAGISGLCTARILIELGYQVQIFEKEGEVGGVWAASRRYPGLTTQNPRDTYAFSDFPMPDDYPEWPSGAQVQAYLEAYADHFDIRRRIALNTEVVEAAMLAGGGGWTLLTRDVGQPASVPCSHGFDWLIICNGIFSVPAIPDYPGIKSFVDAGGQVLHTSQFTKLDDARNRHMVVVGYGKSSCDVANAVEGGAASVTLLARQLIWKIPKRIGNLVNFKHLFLTRLGEGLFPYIRLRGFERFLHGPGRFIRAAMLSTVQTVISRQLRLDQIGLMPAGKLETIARSTVSLVSEGFYAKVEKGRLRVVQDEIVQLGPSTAILKSGAKIAADIIVCGTGWDQQVAFLPMDIQRRVTDASGNFRLYRSTLPIGVPRLLFNGYNSSFFSQLSAEIGSFWIAEYMAGRISLPSDDDQREHVDTRLAWMSARTDGKHCKGTNIVPFSLHHIDELLSDIQLSLPLMLRFKQWFRAVDAAQFRPIGRQLTQRRRS